MKKILSVLSVFILVCYLSSAQDIEKQKIGVTLFNKGKTSNSYRLYSSRNLTAAHLISPDGKYVHTWYYPNSDDIVKGTFSGLGMTWHHAEMLPNGHLPAIGKDEVIVEKETGKILWAWGPGVLEGPHMPNMLPNGNILIYDNGNTLIATSDYGWFFEVTPAGEKVWEYYTPDLAGNGERMGLYRTIPCDKLLSIVKLIETGDIDKAHRWLVYGGLNELGEKEGQFAYNFLYAVRKDVKKSLDSAKKSIESGMSKGVFSKEFSDLFKPLTENPRFADLS
jgi:hypothetical protein